jgi:hypothetical protein
MSHHHQDARVDHNAELPDTYTINVRGPPWLKIVAAKASNTHARLPGLKKLPLPAVAIISFLIFVNIVVWIAAGVVLHYHP